MHVAGGKVYDFKKFALRDARPEDYLTKTTDIPFMTWEEAVRDHSDVIREIEEEFFGRIMVDRRMREYLLDLLAACLDGSIRGQAYERIWILHGPFGANGKSKLVELISATFNSSKNGYVNNCLPVTLLTEKRGAADSASPAKETLRGVRFCFANEPGEAEPQLNCGTIKELTGGDAINSRQLFGEPVQLIPQCKLFLLCNFLPEVSVTDGGTWRRMCVVPFTSRFFVSDDPCSGYDPQNPEHHMSDPAIMEKFARWKVVFAAMLIERHRVLVQEKGKSIREPEPVLSESRRYQETSNRVAKFVHDWVEWIEDEEERRESPPMLLEAAFKRFSAIYGTRKSNAERTAFSRDITAQLKDQTYAGKGGGWLGYRLRDEQ